jgi:chromosome segregation protein
VHLRSLRLRGFKSFPDPVEVRLEPGVAVVVGPNGSGKSNVADGIVWAAGSLSPSELRAEKPDDVLFAGGNGRAPAEHCEVELLFDSSAGDGPLPYSELSIARRLHRGGEGQYLVNRVGVRRTDVVELLADVGLGSGMHSIIGQGRVEEVLGASPERRREFVEEAAGLGRFKRRRHRAELKLARVAVQVERARDVEQEVRGRLRPLALQATAAERAERLAGEIEALRARIAQLDLAACEELLDEAEDRRAAAGLARRLADERLEALLAERERAEEELADAAGRREGATAALYRLRSGAERLAVRRESARALLEDVGAALREADAAEEAPASGLARLEREAADAAGERDRRAGESAVARERLADALRAEQSALESASAEAGLAREEAAETLSRWRGASERVSVRRESATTLAAGVRAELEEAERLGGVDVAALERDAEEAAAAARTARVERDTLAAAAESCSERLIALERSLAELEGLPPAARMLAESGERLVLSGLEVEPGQERAVAAALGWRAAALVARDPAQALAMLEHARAGGLGGVSVLLGDRARELVDGTPVVSAAELLSATQRSVTPEGYGYDPERGELWFAGETAEAVLLELDARRRALAGESAELAARADAARSEADRATTHARVAEEAFAPYVHLATRPRPSPQALARLALLASRLEAGLAGLPELEQRLLERARAARARSEELAERLHAVRRGEHEPELAALQTAAEAADARAADSSALARAAEEALREAAPRRRRLDAAALRRTLAATERVEHALASAAAVAARFEAPLRARVDAGALRSGELAAELRRLGAAEAEARRAAGEAAERVAAIDVELARTGAEAEEARRRLEAASAAPAEGDDAEALAERVTRLEARREALGRVNPLAKEESEREKERLEELAAQRADLEASLAELEKLRADLTDTVERRFAETFDAVATHFEEVASTLFPGGEGRLSLSEPGEDAGEQGVEVELRPAGKRITRLSLLSGGEKALGAISFLFALFLARPCPFYLLDEVEAALDDTNIGRFVDLLRRYADRAQFIVVTHQKRTMEAADVLYGVTMGADGVSQIVSRRLPDDSVAVAG